MDKYKHLSNEAFIEQADIELHLNDLDEILEELDLA